MRADATIAYLRDQIERLTGTRPAADRNGAMPVVIEDVLVWVSVQGHSPSTVRVMGVISDDVLVSTQGHRFVSQTNARLRFLRTWCAAKTLLVGNELWADELSPTVISRLLEQVVTETRRCRAEYAAVMHLRPRREPLPPAPRSPLPLPVETRSTRAGRHSGQRALTISGGVIRRSPAPVEVEAEVDVTSAQQGRRSAGRTLVASGADPAQG